MKVIRTKYRKFTITEKIENDGVSHFFVGVGFLKTSALNSENECRLLIDECYRRAEEKKRAKALAKASRRKK